MRRSLPFPLNLLAGLIWALRVILGSILWVLGSRILVTGLLLVMLAALTQTNRFELAPFLAVAVVLWLLNVLGRKTWRAVFPKRALRPDPVTTPKPQAAKAPSKTPPRARAPEAPPAPTGQSFPQFSPVRQLLQPMPPSKSPNEDAALARLSPQVRALIRRSS